MHHKNIGDPHDSGDRCGVADKIETELVVKGRVNSGRRLRREICIAIGGRTNDHFSGCVGAGTRPFLDDEGLTKALRPIKRVRTSFGPPAAVGTIMRTDRDGNVCARATRDAVKSAAALPARHINRRRGSIMALTPRSGLPRAHAI